MAQNTYENLKCWGYHKNMVKVTTYENGKVHDHNVPLCDVAFTYEGKEYTGEQMIINAKNIDALRDEIKNLATVMQRFIDQVYARWDKEGEL